MEWLARSKTLAMMRRHVEGVKLKVPTTHAICQSINIPSMIKDGYTI